MGNDYISVQTSDKSGLNKKNEDLALECRMWRAVVIQTIKDIEENRFKYIVLKSKFTRNNKDLDLSIHQYRAFIRVTEKLDELRLEVNHRHFVDICDLADINVKKTIGLLNSYLDGLKPLPDKSTLKMF